MGTRIDPLETPNLAWIMGLATLLHNADTGDTLYDLVAATHRGFRDPFECQ